MQVSTGCAPFRCSEIGLHYLSEQTVFTPVGAKQCIRLRCLRHLSEQCLFAPFCRATQKASLGTP